MIWYALAILHTFVHGTFAGSQLRPTFDSLRRPYQASLQAHHMFVYYYQTMPVTGLLL